MSTSNTPTAAILTASSSLRNLQNIQTLEGWSWADSICMWVLKCRLCIDSSNIELVPNETDWYVAVERNYPNGEIELLPAKQHSITKTFQHQYYNDSNETNVPWRNGRICARTGMSSLKKREYDIEPYKPEKRLRWHLTNTLEWLREASAGTLVKEGELFELPDYNTTTSPFTIAYCESPDTFRIWDGLYGHCGIVDLGVLKKPPNTYVTLSFKDHRGNALLEPAWNDYIKSIIERTCVGAWALFHDTIVLLPWQAPTNWEELTLVAEHQRIDYKRLIGRITTPIRDGERHLALLGSPVPYKIGEQPKQIHWQPLYLPVLSWQGDHNGWPSTRRGYLRRDGTFVFRKHSTIDWQKAENWHPTEILNRGSFSPVIFNAQVVVIGAGAFGSMIAEMLVRGGVRDLSIIDNGKTEIGNLVRHTLLLENVSDYKTKALQERLSKISPHAKVNEVSSKFENLNESRVETVKKANIVIDCTGNDDVLNHLEQFPWVDHPVFCSMSIGLQARRSYVFVARKRIFPRAFFKRHVEKWLAKDLKDFDGTELPRSGGIGCWHPAFPARVDDVWLFASAALKYLDSYSNSNENCAKLAVFEQVEDNSVFCGIKLTSEERDNG